MFKHRDISFECLEDGVTSPDNYYLLSIPRIYSKLYQIFEGNESYIPEDYHLLVLAFEKMYKGVCKELQALHPDKIKFSDIVYTNGHRFSQFAATIDNFIPISGSSDGYQKVVDKLHEIELDFNDTRYTKEKSLEEFRSDYKRFEIALDRFLKVLENEYGKMIESEEEEEDLKNW